MLMPVADLETRQLRLLTAIADAGTVTGAAARLHMTQSALSHALAVLERRLGVPLFLRAGRTMVPTEAGERLLRTARAVLPQIEVARQEIQSGAIGRGDFLRMSTECYTAYHWLPPVLCDFREQCPNVELRIVPSATGQPIRALREQTIDVGIVAQRERYRGLVYHPLFDDELVVIVHPGHHAAGRPWFTAADFAVEHLLVFTEDPEQSTVVRHVLTPAGVRPRELSRVLATEALIEMVRAGVGIGVVARWAVAPQLREGALIAIPLTTGGLRRKWSAVVRRGPPPPPLTTLLTLLRRHAPAFQTSRRRGAPGVGSRSRVAR